MDKLKTIIQYLRLLPLIIAMAVADSQIARRSRQRSFAMDRPAPARASLVAQGALALLCGTVAGIGSATIVYQISIDERTFPMTFDPFAQTVAAAFAFVAAMILPAFVAYIVGYFPQLPDALKNTIQGALVLVLTAVLTTIANSIPQVWMDKTVFEAIVALMTLAIGWAGSLFGKYQGMELFIRAQGVQRTYITVKENVE